MPESSTIAPPPLALAAAELLRAMAEMSFLPLASPILRRAPKGTVEIEGLDLAEYETDFYPEHGRVRERIVEPDGTSVESEAVLLGAWEDARR